MPKKTNTGGSAAWAKKLPKRSTLGFIVPIRMVYEPQIQYPKPNASKIKQFARENLDRSTPAEIRLSRLLYFSNHGSMRGRYKQQYIISGKWIVDFYFPEVRLAIEIDGSIHDTDQQKARDREKDADALRFDITLVRIRNSDVLGDKDQLLEKLRNAWRLAKRRENKTIGTKRTF